MQVKVLELHTPEVSVSLRWEGNYHYQAQISKEFEIYKNGIFAKKPK